jgi:hypothetical protein
LILLFKQNVSQQNHRHEVHIYLFIYLLVEYFLIPLTEYAQRKESQTIARTLTYKYTYLFIFFSFSYTNFGLYTRVSGALYAKAVRPGRE